MGPADPILGLNEAFNSDANPSKVNLGVGAYRSDEGKPYVLPSVRAAERALLDAELNKEYLGITGLKDFNDLSVRFAYGEQSPAIAENRVCAVQTLSGTGACRLASEFYSRFMGQGTPMYMPDPTWANHIPIAADAGLVPKTYSYYDAQSCGLDFSGFLGDLEAAPDGSVFLLHACAHNPTGVDPTLEQWREISAVMKRKSHVPFFDCAYQGFASGSAEVDAGAIRLFVDDGHSFALSQSYAKNFGLYGERVGCLSFVCDSPEEAARVESQLKILVRPAYSNPPANGARIVSHILADASLRSQWTEECYGMAQRIISMRSLLRGELEEKLGSTRDWSHVTDQIGMFCFSGISPEGVDEMREDFAIYLTRNGRISMAGVNSSNVGYLAEAMHEVTK